MSNAPIANVNMKKKTIYVADDDEDILQILQTILLWEGFEVITSPDGLSLVELAQPPDLVFLDVAMSGSDGSQICHQYKQNPTTATVPVVLVSADSRLAEKAEQVGADAILHKPFGILEVATVARKYAGPVDD